MLGMEFTYHKGGTAHKLKHKHKQKQKQKHKHKHRQKGRSGFNRPFKTAPYHGKDGQY